MTDTDHEAVGRLAFCGSCMLTLTYPMSGKLPSSNTTIMPEDAEHYSSLESVLQDFLISWGICSHRLLRMLWRKEKRKGALLMCYCYRFTMGSPIHYNRSEAEQN